MSTFELFITAVALSMDAFAVAVCAGLSFKKLSFKKVFTIGAYFGVFQAIMPAIGYFVGGRFSLLITSYDHWVVFALLSFIGLNMVKESFAKVDAPQQEQSISPAVMLPFALATSIDALAAGVGFAFIDVAILPAVLFIGATTLVLSMVGVKVGNVFGLKYKSFAEVAGGAVLILMGTKILLNHLGIISF